MNPTTSVKIDTNTPLSPYHSPSVQQPVIRDTNLCDIGKIDSNEPAAFRPLNGHLVLQSIDPALNRFRAYSISIRTFKTQTQDTIYMVCTAWGRISKLYQSNTRLFHSIKDLEQYIHTNLLTRKRHGYSIVEQSDSFPNIPPINEFAKTKLNLHQPTLF